MKRLLSYLPHVIITMAVLLALGAFVNEAAAGIEELRGELAAIESELAEQRAARDRVRDQELGILAELQLLQQQAEKGRASIQRLKGAEEQAAALVAENRAAIERLERQADERRELLGRRLSLLYMIGRDGGNRFVLSATDFAAMGRRFLFLKAFAAQDREIFDEIKRAVAEQQRHGLELEQALELLERSRAEAEKEQALYEEDLERKRDLLEKVQRERSAYEAVIREKERAMTSLQSKINDIIAAQASAETGRDLSAADIPDAGVWTSEVPSLRIWPTEGRIIRYYGRVEDPVYGTTTKSDGIDIAAPSGQYFVSVLPGEVIYADWFQGYGKMLIIAHDDGVHTVYAHAESLLVGVNDVVTEGQRIGRVGSTGSITEPSLHFEIRKAGRAVDPLAFLAQ
ncbi:MAG: peptidoglycan DD-metalloendopeptidase family protein [Candidatus Coatesbacteria bacterium]|nr:peptidoglycan DD-metalloendopeptidase family protein [Candidatus Coatesbacteria bacterium]